MTGYEYGNTRLRVRHSRRLDLGDYRELIAVADLDQMLGALSTGVYRNDVESAVARYSGVRRLDETVRAYLAREYSMVSSFYEEPVSSRLSLISDRWDVRNLVGLLRAQSAPEGASGLLSRLVPAGRMSAADLAALAAEPGVRAMVDLAVVLRLPNVEMARALRKALPEFEAVGTTVVLEVAALRLFAERVERHHRDEPDDPLIGVLWGEQLAVALTTALRLRAGRLAGEPSVSSEAGVIVSAIPADTVEAVVASDRADVAAGILMGTGLPPAMAGRLEEWVTHGDIGRLADDLDAVVTGVAAAAFRADPLGVGVPVGYLWGIEREAKNLLLIGRFHVHGLDPEDVEERLVVM